MAVPLNVGDAVLMQLTLLNFIITDTKTVLRNKSLCSKGSSLDCEHKQVNRDVHLRIFNQEKCTCDFTLFLPTFQAHLSVFRLPHNDSQTRTLESLKAGGLYPLVGGFIIKDATDCSHSCRSHMHSGEIPFSQTRILL